MKKVKDFLVSIRKWFYLTPAEEEQNGYDFAISYMNGNQLNQTSILRAISYGSNDPFDKGIQRAIRDYLDDDIY